MGARIQTRSLSSSTRRIFCSYVAVHSLGWRTSYKTACRRVQSASRKPVISRDDPNSKQALEVAVKALQEVETGDIVSYGLIPEFVGRFPVCVPLTALGEKELVDILTKPRDAVGKQYQRLLDMHGADLNYTDDALSRIAQAAIRRGTGARGLRTLLERLLTDACTKFRTIRQSRECSSTARALKRACLDEVSLGLNSFDRRLLEKERKGKRTLRWKKRDETFTTTWHYVTTRLRITLVQSRC